MGKNSNDKGLRSTGTAFGNSQIDRRRVANFGLSKIWEICKLYFERYPLSDKDGDPNGKSRG
jgi:hypothetical protein